MQFFALSSGPGESCLLCGCLSHIFFDILKVSTPSVIFDPGPNFYTHLTLISRKYIILVFVCLVAVVVVVVVVVVALVVFTVDSFVISLGFVCDFLFVFFFFQYSLYRFLCFFNFRRGENNNFPHTFIFVSVSVFRSFPFRTLYSLAFASLACTRIITIRQKGTFKNICVEKWLS